MKNNMRTGRAKIIALVGVLAVSTIGVSVTKLNRMKNNKTVPTSKIASMVKENDNKLMIVAHPDDETLWGGGHLKQGGYFVMCITNGQNKRRAAEFRNAIKESGNDGIILYYPDKINGKRSDWKQVWNKITDDVKFVMEFKDWKEMVTHNKDGEYGHNQHKALHKIVKQVYDKGNVSAPLYFFGHYYRPSKVGLHPELIAINDDEYNFKLELEKKYPSQKRTVGKFKHMSRFEMWEKYEKNNDKNISDNKIVSLDNEIL